ncbi:putative DD41D transposase [Trichonephila clavipes]|nr:putative DD41D transposase [Trichonephila clavipes]
MISYNPLDYSLRGTGTSVDRLESGQSQAEVSRWLQVARKRTSSCGINLKKWYFYQEGQPRKLTVWCALWAGGILLQNDEGHNVTVNGDQYRTMITNFFIPELNNHDVEELWFQQDGATCHTARATIHLLKDTFGDLLISRFGPVNWPPRSCDLTPLDYFL